MRLGLDTINTGISDVGAIGALNANWLGGLDRAAFVAAGRTRVLADVMSAAGFRGELEPLRQVSFNRSRLADLACQRELEPDEVAVDEIAGDYRYGRDLTTAEECERWLMDRGLSVEDFQAHCLRVYWEKQLAGDEGGGGNGADDEPEEVARWFEVDLLLSDDFDRLARQLAWRAALACDHHLRDISTQPTAASTTLPPGDSDGISSGVATTPDRIEELRRMEDTFQTRCRELLTVENQRRCLASLRLPLTRFELDILQLDEDLAAREAYLCITQDHMSLAEVAVEADYELSSLSTLLQDLRQEWQPIVLSAAVGTVLPPFGSGEERFLCLVTSKQEPTLDRPEVETRVNRTILRQHFMELEARHVQWQIRVDPAA